MNDFYVILFKLLNSLNDVGSVGGTSFSYMSTTITVNTVSSLMTVQILAIRIKMYYKANLKSNADLLVFDRPINLLVYSLP